MKKSIIVFTLIFGLSMVLLSCKNNNKQTTETKMNETHSSENRDIAMHDVYQCPMDCEKGKTYDEPGSCPVCKMDLQKVKKEDDHEGHEH